MYVYVSYIIYTHLYFMFTTFPYFSSSHPVLIALDRSPYGGAGARTQALPARAGERAPDGGGRDGEGMGMDGVLASKLSRKML